MNKGATRKTSGEKSSKSRSLPLLSPTELRRSTGERFSFSEPPSGRQNSPLGRLAPIQYNEISKALANGFQWVRRAAGIPQGEDVNTKSKMAEWVAKEHSPASLEKCCHHVLRKPFPGFPHNCVPYRMAALFNSTPVEGGTRHCWDNCVSCEDGLELPRKIENCFYMRVLVPTTPLEILRTNEKCQKELEQLDLKAPLTSEKTNWKVVQEVHELLKVVLTVLESTVNEVNDKFEFYKTSKNRKCGATYYAEDNEDIVLYEALCESFDDVSSAGVEHCLQAIHLVANCIAESQEMTDFAPKFLLQAALDFVNTCSRITRAQESMIIKKKSAVYAIEWSLEQEDKRVNHVWKLIETISGCVVASQNRVLQLAPVQLNEIGTYKEQTLKLESHLQQSWTWSNRISKRVAVLCPSKKKDVFVCLLSAFIQATEELCHCQNQVWSSVKGERKRLVCSGVCSFHQRLLHCLVGLFCNAKEVVAELKKSGLISDCDFPQVSIASDNLSQVLTLLLSTVPEHISISIPHSCLLTEAAMKSGNHLIPLTKEYLEIVLSIVPKNTPENEGIEDRLKKLCRVLNNVHDELKSKIRLKVDSDSSEDQTEPANANHEEPDCGPLISATDNEQTEPARILNEVASEKRAKPSAFANLSSYPAVEVPDNPPAPETEAVSTPLTKDTLKEEEFPSEGADSSLDRILPSMPCPDSFGRIHIKELTEEKHIGNGSSGVVTLMKHNNISVAVKEPVCPDPNRARQRLERECTIHQRLNSHANIVRFLGRVAKTDEFGTDQIAGIITEWCQLGDLRSAIKDAAWIQELDRDGQDVSFMSDRVGYHLYKDWTKRLEIIADVAAGMVFMHSNNIVHRELTCKHVLFDSIGSDGEFGVKICDFERAYYLPGGQPIQRTEAPANSPPWMGPEVLNHEKYGLKADVYSIGTLLWQLMYLENPWTHLKQRVRGGSTLIQQLLSIGKISLAISEDDAPEDVPEFPDLIRLVKYARERDPDNRPTMAEFYKEVVEICTRMKERVLQKT